jgi:hypothetical protein
MHEPLHASFRVPEIQSRVCLSKKLEITWYSPHDWIDGFAFAVPAVHECCKLGEVQDAISVDIDFLE